MALCDSSMMTHRNGSASWRVRNGFERYSPRILYEEIVTSRQVVANAARKQQQSNKEAKDKTLMFAAGGIKDTHDTIYKKKYVPKSAAEALQGSKYAGSVA